MKVSFSKLCESLEKIVVDFLKGQSIRNQLKSPISLKLDINVGLGECLIMLKSRSKYLFDANLCDLNSFFW